MKSFKTMMLTGIFIIVLSGSKAQNYRVLQPDRISMYESEYGRILGMRVDSVQTEGNDTIYHLLKNLQQIDYECYQIEGPSWMGDHLVIHQNGDTEFFNLNQQSILIRTRAAPNVSWVCYSTPALSFMATVDSVSLSEFLGITDSVRYISFQAQNSNGQNISHYINAKRIAISKNSGLTRTFNFFNFPDVDYGFVLHNVQEMNLTGITNPQSGVQNLTWLRAHDHQPGDELHCISENGSMYSQSETEEIMRLIGKSVTGDTVTNVWERKIKHTVYQSGNQTFTASMDTAIRIITPKPDFDLLPGVACRLSYLRFDDYDTHSMGRNDIALTKSNGGMDDFVSCWDGDCCTSGIFDGCSPPHIYYEGLGGPYYYCSFFGFDYTKRRLVYYKKNGIEWGTPIDFTVDTHPRLFTASSAGFEVQPNPARDVIVITCRYNRCSYRLLLSDSSGRTLLDEMLQGETNTLNIGMLKQGLYYLRFVSDDRMETKKLVKH